jgi:predicted amino acid dehydrogenase
LRAGDAHALFAHLVLARSHERSIAIAREKREPTTRASCERRVGFIGYFVDAEQMPKFDPSLARFSTFAREELVRKTFGAIEPAHSGSAIVRSIDGSEVELRYYGLFVDSRTFYENLRGEGREVLRAQIERAARMAREDGCTVVGFGGLTSVVTANCRDIAVEGVALTTGNSLTVAMCIEAARREALAMGIDLSESTIAAVGAGGNIGSVYSLRMSDEAARMVLVARAGHEASLEALRCAIYERAYGRLLEASDETGALSDDAPLRRGVSRALHRFEGVRELLTRRIAARGGEIAEIVKSAPPVEVTSDLRALRDASLVLGASNAPHALIKREHLGEGPVLVVDVAVPGDADSSVAALAPRVKVISGGAVDLGIANASLVPQAPLPRGHLYACAAETIVLGLEGRRESFSVGAIDLAQVEEILALATKHGFGLSNEAHVSALAPLKASA